MALIVQKFGGSSVADRERLFRAARIVADTHGEGHHVVVVVSAQGDTTDELLEKAGQISAKPSPRELDMLLSAGEQISAALLCMALKELGVSAVSLTGWQAGFCTDRQHTRARIRHLDTGRVERELAQNRVVVVAGFQGIHDGGDITTLGRGGSDTSAVALACALGAQRCCIYTDVDGVYTADPRIVPQARRLREISFDEMLELAGVGAQVLHGRSVELARYRGLPLKVLSGADPGGGTLVTEACSMEAMQIKSVAVHTKVSLLSVAVQQDALQPLLDALEAQAIPVRQTLQTADCEDGFRICLLVDDANAAQAQMILSQQAGALGIRRIRCDGDIACLSVVGSGLGENADALPRLLKALAAAGQKPQLLAAGEVRISAVIGRSAAKEAVRSVHAAFFEN